MRRLLTTAAALLIAVALGAQAGAAPKPQIEDPLGDANFLNDQGTGDGSTSVNQADAGTVSDITAVTIWNNAKTLYLRVDTEAAPPAATGIGYRVRVNPSDAGTYCLEFEVYHPGANNIVTTPVGYLYDRCEGGDPIPLKILGTQWEIPRSAHKAFAKGAKLVAPQAQAFLYSGDGSQGATYPVADTTVVGTDFAFKK